MRERMVQLSLRIPVGMQEEIEEACERTGESVSEFVRNALSLRLNDADRDLICNISRLGPIDRAILSELARRLARRE